MSFRPTDLLPVDPVLLVCAFVDPDDPDLFDNNQDNPWVVPFYRGRDTAPGFHYQVFRLRTREIPLPDVLRLPGGHAQIAQSIEAELATNPDHLPAHAALWMAPLFKTQYGSEEYEALRQPIRARLDSVFSELILRGEPDSLAASLMELYGFVDMEGGADSLVSRLRERFPDSRLVILAEFEAAKIPDEDSVRFQRLEEFMRAYSETRLAAEARDLLVQGLLYAEESDKLLEMMESGVSLEPSGLWYLASALLDSSRTDDAERLMRRCVEDLERETRPEQSPYSVDEWRRDHEREMGYALHWLAYVVAEKENHEEAVGLLSRVVSTMPDAVDPILLGNLADWQTRLGRKLEALETYDRLGEMNDPDAGVLKDWRTLYSEVHGSDEGFEEHLAALSAERRSKKLARLDRVALRWPAPDVTIRDFEGNAHSLADFRGKVVLLDFWATWCGPCMRALPHLDTLFGEWETGDEIAILPINAKERGSPEERIQRIQETWSNLGLSLPVYLDAGADEESSLSAATQFKVSGIPATFILDRDGNILFKHTGFSGKDSVNEIRLEIEFAMSGVSAGT